MYIKGKQMNLEEQLLNMGMNPEDAKKNAENFVTGLKELGLSDSTPEPTPAVMRTNNSNIQKALTALGVRSELIKKYASSIDKAMTEFGVTTKDRQAMFLAQLLHESALLTATIENLNYSELGLVKVFKNYFDRNSAKRYARQPEKIANRVYANRMGNGNEMSGDGWRYRGRGLIQLTGKDNYIACGKGLGVDLLKNPDYLLTPEGSARSAGWYWKSRKLNASADAKDIGTNTKLINGGLNGLAHRTELYRKLLTFL
jgi:putative chitinase